MKLFCPPLVTSSKSCLFDHTLSSSICRKKFTKEKRKKKRRRKRNKKEKQRKRKRKEKKEEKKKKKKKKEHKFQHILDLTPVKSVLPPDSPSFREASKEET